ncbi:MAG: helix-turn-helix domain-containing protein [Pseudonocardiaceae bacterium]
MSEPTFRAELRRLREQSGLSLKKFALLVHYDPGYLSKVENGLKPPTAPLAEACDTVLDTGGSLSALVPATVAPESSQQIPQRTVQLPLLIDGRQILLRLDATSLAGEDLECNKPTVAPPLVYPSRRDEADPVDHKEETGKDFMTDQKRRRLLFSLVTQGGAAAAVPLFEALRAIRARADLLLETQSVSPSTVEKWETVAHNYGHLHLSTPPYIFLTQLLCDFDELQNILNRRQPLEVQKRLYRVMAQLAGLIGISTNNISTESQSWFHTAQLAADEVGDRALRAWATAHEGMSYLWWGRPVAHVIGLAQKAEIIAGSTPNAGGAVAAAMEARAQARLGRHRETASAIRRAEAIFEHLDTEDTATNVLGFYEHFLRFCQENALTSLGDTAAALAAQQRTLELVSSGGDVVDSALVRLDRATCLIRDGELPEGCHVAGQTLLELPPETRRGVPLTRAREVMKMIEPRDNQLDAVRSFHEIIQSSAA